ncbi:MAG TPA: AAA family ATPase [Solirubrobacteraceae bacterium]|nr:AAA family ATPase [Solirubrobacteraceae bacterium]
MAGEAGAPFFSISASEFVEMVVGVGASRVRDLFGEAKREASAIVFIDELDAIGRRRSSATGVSGGNDEREQTLNQILTEMDGFEQGEAVIVLAATNRPQDLDEALIRPGRFDRQVPIGPPDRDGRLAILRVHTRSLPLGADVELERLAAMTPGMTGADLANLANEAALAAARRERSEVTFAAFEEAFDRLALGRPRGITLSEEDRRLTAYHEAGHALVGMLTPGSDPVRKVTIMPRGQALGVTLAAPDDDRVSFRRTELVARMRVMLGGRAAEELACEDITTGAENDLEQVTEIARRMAGRWGMTDRLGPLSLLPREAAASPLDPSAGGGSEDARRRVDEEAERLVREAHDDVVDLLAGHREQLDALASALLERETLEADAAYTAVGIRHRPGRVAEPAG